MLFLSGYDWTIRTIPLQLFAHTDLTLEAHALTPLDGILFCNCFTPYVNKNLDS